MESDWIFSWLLHHGARMNGWYWDLTPLIWYSLRLVQRRYVIGYALVGSYDTLRLEWGGDTAVVHDFVLLFKDPNCWSEK